MNGHVAKPVRQAELHAAIAAALAGRPGRAATLNATVAVQAETKIDEGPATFDSAVFDDVRQMLPSERLAAHLDTLAGQVEMVASGPESVGGTEELAAAAHKIVSQAGMLGLPRLSERARAVEEAARGGAGPNLEDALTRFRESAIDLGEAEAALG
jgi:HPt (histidine-containing phosphotransfer) domain-containing protein